MHSWQRRKDMVSRANDFKDLTEMSVDLVKGIGEVATERIAISDLSIGDISEEDIATENGARVAKKTGTITLQNPHTDRDVTITPTFVGDQCYITQINASGEPTEYFGKVIVPSSDQLPELEPGEETNVDFTCLVPLDIEAGSYDLSMTVQANPYAINEAHKFTMFSVDIDASSAMESQKLTDETLTEGDATRTTYEPTDNSIMGTIRMDYGGSDLDLHLYDNSGQHVGRNYDTGEIEREITSVTYSGPDSGTESSEWIRADNISQLSELETEVVALETDSDGSSFSVTAIDIPALPPELKVYPNPILLTGEADSTLEGELTVAEIGGHTAPNELSVELTELSHESNDHTIDDSTVEIDDSVSIDAGGQTITTLTIEIPEEAYSGTYNGTMMVDGDESAYTADLNLVITEGNQPDASQDKSSLPNVPPWAATVAAGGGTALGTAGLLKYLYSDSDVSSGESD